MATFTVYYETGSIRRGTLKRHKQRFAAKKSAVEAARKVSQRRAGSYITVLSKGIEVAECYRGRCVVQSPAARLR